MQCLKPITISYRDRFESLRKNGMDTGKYEGVKKLHPDWSDKRIAEYLYPSSRIVPCGKCAACLSNRRTAWVSRLSYELYHSSNGHFFTLTFDDDHLVYDIKTRNPVALMDLASDFIVKIRSKIFRKQRSPLKYFVVSEYGPKTCRPHFHMLLFNLPLDVDLRTIENLWYHGNIVVDHINGSRIGYVTKYCLAKIDPDLWCIDDIGYRPSMRCSKGLGSGLLDDKVLSKQYKDGLLYDGYVSNDRYRVSVSRYYKDRLLSTREKIFVSDKSMKYSDDYRDKFVHDKDFRLEQKSKAASLEYNINKSIKKSNL